MFAGVHPGTGHWAASHTLVSHLLRPADRPEGTRPLSRGTRPKSAPDPGRPSNRRGAISFSKSWVELFFRARLQAECGEAYSRFCESWFGLPFRARLRAELGGQSDFITKEVSRHCQGEFEGG